MKYRIIALLSAVALALGLSMVSATSATAAKGGPSAAAGPTYILDSSGFRGGSLGADVASYWSKNTGVTVTPGSCDLWDPRCIKAYSVDGAVCNGTVGAVGCATDDPTGGCTVELSEAFLSSDVASYAYDFNALAHETGHCIIHRLGGGYWHASNPSDIMYGGIHYSDPIKRITRETKTYIAALL